MNELFINTISIKSLLYIAKRSRYKYIEDNYFHFIFNGIRVECIYSNNYHIVCLVSGKESRSKMNDYRNFNSNIIFIKDNYNHQNYDLGKLIRFDEEFKIYYNSIYKYKEKGV